MPVQKKSLNLQLNPRIFNTSEVDVISFGIRLHTKGVYLTLYFLALRNLRNFEFAVKNEAIVDALRVRLCAFKSLLYEVIWIDCIYILRGVALPLLILLQWQSQGLEERNEQGVAPRFSLLQYL